MGQGMVPQFANSLLLESVMDEPRGRGAGVTIPWDLEEPDTWGGGSRVAFDSTLTDIMQCSHYR